MSRSRPFTDMVPSREYTTRLFKFSYLKLEYGERRSIDQGQTSVTLHFFKSNHKYVSVG